MRELHGARLCFRKWAALGRVREASLQRAQDQAGLRSGQTSRVTDTAALQKIPVDMLVLREDADALGRTGGGGTTGRKRRGGGGGRSGMLCRRWRVGRYGGRGWIVGGGGGSCLGGGLQTGKAKGATCGRRGLRGGRSVCGGFRVDDAHAVKSVGHGARCCSRSIDECLNVVQHESDHKSSGEEKSVRVHAEQLRVKARARRLLTRSSASQYRPSP
jgi:hypothetical protein